MAWKVGTVYAKPLSRFNSDNRKEIKTMADRLSPNDDLAINGAITSQNGGSTLVIQENGNLVIPLPTRVITIADLVGEWGHNDGITTRYVDPSGTYTGFESLHFTKK